MRLTHFLVSSAALTLMAGPAFAGPCDQLLDITHTQVGMHAGAGFLLADGTHNIGGQTHWTDLEDGALPADTFDADRATWHAFADGLPAFIGESVIEALHESIDVTFDDLHDSGIFSWTYLYGLGANKDEIWRRYLLALEARGLGRDP